jgi:hypothetical protein
MLKLGPDGTRNSKEGVDTLTKHNQDKMAEETGIQSLTEEDMKEYLEQL